MSLLSGLMSVCYTSHTHYTHHTHTLILIITLPITSTHHYWFINGHNQSPPITLNIIITIGCINALILVNNIIITLLLFIINITHYYNIGNISVVHII